MLNRYVYKIAGYSDVFLEDSQVNSFNSAHFHPHYFPFSRTVYVVNRDRVNWSLFMPCNLIISKSVASVSFTWSWTHLRAKQVSFQAIFYFSSLHCCFPSLRIPVTSFCSAQVYEVPLPIWMWKARAELTWGTSGSHWQQPARRTQTELWLSPFQLLACGHPNPAALTQTPHLPHWYRNP